MTRILILGGGIGGLALAALLERRVPSTEITLAEQTNAWAPLGAGITLTGNALRVLAEAGLGAEILKRGLELERSYLTNHRGGVLIEATNEESPGSRDEWSSKVVSIHRASLHEALLGSIERTELRLGTTIEQIDVGDAKTGARVSLTGTSEHPAEPTTFDLVIGADGANSRLRREVLAAEPPPMRYAGYTCWRGVVDMPGSDVAEARRSWELWGGARRLGVIPIGDGRVYFYACHNAPADDPRYQDLGATEFADLFEGLGGPAPAVLEAVRSSGSALVLHQDDLGEIKLPKWHRGPAVLIGDAAHAMTPNLGQGAAMAIEDAAVLSEELAQDPSDPAGAAQRYETRRRPRVERLQQQAFQLGSTAHWESKVACWLRNAALRMIPASFGAGQLRAMVDEQI